MIKPLPLVMSSRSDIKIPLLSIGLNNSRFRKAVHSVFNGEDWPHATGTVHVAGWGLKRSGRRALALARRRDCDPLLLEDGFLCAADHKKQLLSLSVDDLGMYFNANEPSRLEKLVAEPIDEARKKQAKKLVCLWKRHRTSKYNAAREYSGALAEGYVLVVDQVRNDHSIQYGLASENSFENMLRAALAENPEKKIIVKLHPDVYTKSAASHFDPHNLEKMERVQVIAENCHPVRLVENADAVYTVTSQMGFEALIWGKRVRTFGMPFYAGWGLTEDEMPSPARRGQATLEQLVHAALVQYPRYIDPLTDQRCNVEQALEHIAFQRRKRLEFPDDILGVGFSRWKKTFVKQFLQGSRVTFSSELPSINKFHEKAIAVWGVKYHSELYEFPKVLRLEDGFLRSAGLGADLVRPLSLVLDDVGIYYDATRPSRLEKILNQQILSKAQLARARRLNEKIVSLGLTKYNLGAGEWRRPKEAGQVILVVGQVESDASIEYGSPDIKTNIGLLTAVRSDYPTAYIVYKPHPDVVAKLRRKGKNEMKALSNCDEVVYDLPADVLFREIDELHTMTSLMGFEALLRGVSVVCHGLPFYAGWGLTKDKLPCERRTKQLSLDGLVYGTLITYPRYFHHQKEIFIEPEVAVEELARLSNDGVKTRSLYRKLLRLLVIFWSYVRKQDQP